MDSKILFRHMRDANLRYRLIEDGDRVAVGVSGGKDSLVLLYGLALFRQYTPLKFEVLPITIDLGWEMDWSPLTEFCSSLSFPHHIIPTNIGPLVLRERRESNPCALCSNLRSGSMHKNAVALGCNKVALGHHLDDAVTTLMMSMVFEGQYRTFKPATYLDRMGLTLIRPLVYAPESGIIELASTLKLPVIKNACPATSGTNRDTIKSYLNQIEARYPGAWRRMLNAMENVNTDSFWLPNTCFDTEDHAILGSEWRDQDE